MTSIELNSRDDQSIYTQVSFTTTVSRSIMTSVPEETSSVPLGENDSSDSLYDQFTALDQDIIAAYLFIIGFFSVSSNILCIIIYTKTKKLRTPLNMMCINLCVSDLVVAVFGTFFKFAFTVMDKPLSANTHLCNWYGFATYIGGKISVCLC